ncbi:SGNH/GDSL hydrolase family protein [Rossellomorea aquimaris]|uniref:SGNH/GDSL hydrolase family protein n=1 Tax=Rossellomorea aquimaris TaxID=189382 RepID=A0A5D4TVQ4_9BACI|nr:SGNH/GDSL hydrolase family protein [Rossellomorea aquimaris]TYS78542.1 SGNH/GDSL hydrolase family protein [Rossellomorea aquimaris]
MKKLFIVLLMLVSVGVILLGNLHWKTLNSAPAATEAESTDLEGETETKDEASKESSPDGKLSYTGNWSPEMRSIYENKLEEGEAFNLMIAGSQAMDAVEPGWNDLVAEAVKAKYGDTITVHSFPYDSNSFDFVAEAKAEEIADLDPNLVIFEPLTLNDNSLVRIEDSLVHIQTIYEDISASNVGMELVLTPPQPVHSPNWYATQISELEKFADNEGYTYIDHWENWPDVESEEIKNYLNGEGSSPNEQGQKAWAEAIISYLITE